MSTGEGAPGYVSTGEGAPGYVSTGEGAPGYVSTGGYTLRQNWSANFMQYIAIKYIDI